MKRSALIHPFLFALVSVLFLYFSTSAYISPLEMGRPVLFLFFLLTLVIFPAYKITKNWDWAGIILTIFVFGFYCEETIFIILFLSSASTIIIWLLYLRLRRKAQDIRQITFLLNFLSFILLLGGALNLLFLLLDVPYSFYQKNILTNERTEITVLKSPPIKPDIYYIILDGYARSDILKELYNFDNSEFISTLQEKNFIVPSDNLSNYHRTLLSIPSTLNMDYIQTLTNNLEETRFGWLMASLNNYSQSRVVLEKIGYKTVSISVDWTITNNKTTDIYYQPYSIQISEFEKHILDVSALKILLPLIDKLAFLPSLDTHRELILYNFESLAQISTFPEPKFIFAHIIAPHPPFVFDKDGNHVDPSKSFSSDAEGFVTVAKRAGLETEEEIHAAYREGYIEQVEFLNKQVIQVVDDILQNSETPPIIIFQADHGSGMLTDFRSSEKTCLHERFSPFAAYYLPNIDQNAIPADITPVNLFRIIFNEYFDANLPLLENAYYFSKDPFYVYELEEISLQKIKQPCKTQP